MAILSTGMMQIKKGYSGTLIYTKKKPLQVIYGIEGYGYNFEGRVITLEYETYYFVVAYVPNSKKRAFKLDDRMIFEDDMRTYLKNLDSLKPVIYTGDLNVAHMPIDLSNPGANTRNPGLQMKRETSFLNFLKVALLIHLEHFIQIRLNTLGGAICFNRD